MMDRDDIGPGAYVDHKFVKLYVAAIAVVLERSIVENVPFFPAMAWKPAEDAYLLLVKKQRGDTDC